LPLQVGSNKISKIFFFALNLNSIYAANDLNFMRSLPKIFFVIENLCITPDSIEVCSKEKGGDKPLDINRYQVESCRSVGFKMEVSPIEACVIDFMLQHCLHHKFT
jgi:hypothetical protein